MCLHTNYTYYVCTRIYTCVCEFMRACVCVYKNDHKREKVNNSRGEKEDDIMLRQTS